MGSKADTTPEVSYQLGSLNMGYEQLHESMLNLRNEVQGLRQDVTGLHKASHAERQDFLAAIRDERRDLLADLREDRKNLQGEVRQVRDSLESEVRQVRQAVAYIKGAAWAIGIVVTTAVFPIVTDVVKKVFHLSF